MTGNHYFQFIMNPFCFPFHFLFSRNEAGKNQKRMRQDNYKPHHLLWPAMIQRIPFCFVYAVGETNMEAPGLKAFLEDSGVGSGQFPDAKSTVSAVVVCCHLLRPAFASHIGLWVPLWCFNQSFLPRQKVLKKV